MQRVASGAAEVRKRGLAKLGARRGVRRVASEEKAWQRGSRGVARLAASGLQVLILFEKIKVAFLKRGRLTFAVCCGTQQQNQENCINNNIRKKHRFSAQNSILYSPSLLKPLHLSLEHLPDDV